MMGRYSINSAMVARRLSKFGKPPKPVASLSPEFNVPRYLWNYLRESPYEQTMKPEKLLPMLFSLSRSSEEKAVAGYLMLEHGLKLKLHEEKEYVLSLVKCGLVSEAVKMWNKRELGEQIDKKTFFEFLVLINCRSHRVKDAERLVADKTPSSAMAFEFVKAYSQLRDQSGVYRWTMALIESKASQTINRSALRELVKSRMWSSAQSLMKGMTERGHIVPSDVSAACVLAANRNVTEASVASLLSRDGAILNSPLLRLAVGKDPRREVSILLRKKKFTEALNILESYHGPHELSLCYKLLLFQQSSALIDRAGFKNRMKPVYARVQKSPERNGRFIQFMITYYFACRDYDQLWKFVSAYRLASPTPLISPLSVSNYQLLWRVTLTAVKEQQTSQIPFNLRTLLVTTLLKVALTPRLVRLMVVSLFYEGDLQGLVTLLEFAAEKSGIELDEISLRTLFPNELPSNRNWRTVAGQLCQAFSRDLCDLELAAEPLRNEIWMH